MKLACLRQRKNGWCFLLLLFSLVLFLPLQAFADDDDDDDDGGSYAGIDFSDDDIDYSDFDIDFDSHWDDSDDEFEGVDDEIADFYSGDVDMGDDAWHNPDDDVEDWYEHYGLKNYGETSEQAEELVNNVVAAETALEEAKAAGADAATIAELAENLAEARAELNSFCESHEWSYVRDDDGTYAVFNNHGVVVTVVGDPVMLASGIFLLDDTDIVLSVGKTAFSLARHYTSDGQHEADETAGAFGIGWNSVFDSRIILGCFVRAEELLPAWEVAVSSAESYAELIASYAEEDPNCEAHAIEMNTLLQERIAQYEQLRTVAAQSSLHRGKNAFVAYGYAGQMAQNLGCDGLIFVDDYGNPALFTRSETEIVAKSVTVRQMLSLSYDDETDSYVAQFATGETRRYDGYGLLSAISFAHGGYIRFLRNAAHQVQSISVNGRRSLSLAWAEGRLVSASDGTRTIGYGYRDNRLSAVTDEAGDTKSYAYDEKGRMVKQIKPDGSFIAFGYELCDDGKERTAWTTNENGATEYFSYDLARRRTTYTDHDGVQSVYEYDEQGRTTKESYADGKVVTYAYDAVGKLIARESMGNRETYRYDADGHLVFVQYGDGSSLRQQYAGNNLVSSTDRDGVTTTGAYDAHGNCIVVSRGGKTVWEYAYNAFGQVTSARDCRGNRIEYGYDEKGNLVQKKVFASGASSGCATETWGYDAAGRVIRYMDGAGITHTYRYEPHAVYETTSNGFEASCFYSSRKDLIRLVEKDTLTGEERIFRYGYDKCHNCTNIWLSGTDGHGKTYAEIPIQTTRYTGHGRLSQAIIWNDGGNSWQTVGDFDAAGNVSHLTYGFVSANGAATETPFSVSYARSWTADGYQLSEIDADGRERVYAYDGQNRLIQLTDTGLVRLAYQYSAGGRIVRAKTEQGGFLTYRYDASTGFFAGTQEENGTLGADFVQCYADGKKAVLENPQGAKTYYYYDAFGLLCKIVADGKTETWTHDALGRMLAHTVSAPDGTVVAEASVSYRADGRTIVYTRGAHLTTTYRTNAFGEIISMTDALGNTRHFVYDIRGRCIEFTDAYGTKTQCFYDGKNHLIKKIDRRGAVTTYAYDFDGNCTRITDAGGDIFRASYDKSGRVTEKNQMPASAASERYTYDGLDRVTSVLRGTDVVLQCVFSADGKTIQRTDARGKTATYQTDGFGRLLSETNRLGLMQTFAYRDDGSLHTYTDYARAVTVYAYERLKNTLSVTYADGSYSIEERDAVGNIVRVQNDGGSIFFTYDTAGLLLSQYDEASDSLVSYTYDACGRRIRLQSEKQDIRYQYGKNNELTAVSDETNALSVYFVYDAEGNEIKRTYASGEWVQSVYDGAGRLILNVGYNRAGAVVFVDGAVFDENGRKTLSLDTHFSVTRYSYDDFGHLASVQYAYTDEAATYLKNLCASSGVSVGSGTIASSVLSLSSAEYAALTALCSHVGTGFSPKTTETMISESFTYDKNGNLIRRQTPFGAIDYAYDDENRLVSWGNGCSAQYDANGNMIAKKNLYKSELYAYNEQRRLKKALLYDLISSAVSEFSCEYDAFGRRTLVSSAEEGSMRTVYDGLSFNEMYAVREQFVTSDDGAKNSGFRYTYLSDAENERTRTVSARTKAVSATTEHDMRLAYVSLYGNGQTPIALTWLTGGSAERFALFSDSIGTVKTACAIDGIGRTASYDVFGANLSADDSASSVVPYGFAGKKSVASLYDFGYRDYAPDFSRFTTPDPIRDGLNWYGYCNGDPVNYVDWLGLFISKPHDMEMQDGRWGDELLGRTTLAEEFRQMSEKNGLSTYFEQAGVGTFMELIEKKYTSDNHETIATAGCAVTGVSAIVSMLTGEDVTPHDINAEKSNFSKEKTDELDMGAVAARYGLDYDYWTKDKQETAGLESKINELNASATVYAVLAEVYYDGSHTHRVGLDGAVITIDGKNYVAISATSKNDVNVSKGSLRGGAGWIARDGAIYVPTDKIVKIQQFSEDVSKNQ